MLRIRWTPTPLSASSGLDSETALVIIKQQARRIDELERENESLRGKLKTLAS